MLSDVPEDSPGALTPPARTTSPYAAAGPGPHPSTSSLTSVASAAKAPAGPRTPSNLRIGSATSLRAVHNAHASVPPTPTPPVRDPATPTPADKDSDRASIAAPSVAGMMTSTSAAKGTPRSKSPGGATIREQRRERRGATKDKDADEPPPVLEKGVPPKPRYRETPRLPSARDVEPAPATLMYWSRAPVYGFLPTHGLRAHTTTLVDGVAWIFGGCDEKGCWKDVWCFHTGEHLQPLALGLTSCVPQRRCNGHIHKPWATSRHPVAHTLRRSSTRRSS